MAMKIGYLLSPGVLPSGASNGVRQQALTWMQGLQLQGHSVELITPGAAYDWHKFDVVHLFQAGEWLRCVVPGLRKRVRKLVLSPIIDSNVAPKLYRLAARLQIPPLRLRTENAITRSAAHAMDIVSVRSAHEWAIVETGLGVDVTKIRLNKIPFTVRSADSSSTADGVRQPVCLHVSSFTQERKNVKRLIQACSRCGIELWIAGSPGSTADFAKMKQFAAGKPVRFLGFVNDAELTALMRQAKVFALPSLNEGVGLSALEAASLGCEVVVTGNGGPPDYFSQYAHYVDPYSVESIAAAISEALGASRQPMLSEHVSRSFTVAASCNSLLAAYG